MGSERELFLAAVCDLIDESERVYYANLEDGKNLIHLGRSIKKLKDCLAAVESEEKNGS